MRLINADKLKEKYSDYWDREIEHPKYQDTFGSIIDNEPTVEVIEHIKSLYKDEPSEMSPSYEYIVGWNEALDAILRELGEDVD